MSQSRNQPDTQALLQSMLQRLKLQPGREGQAYLHAPGPIAAASTWGQGGERGASDLQKVNNSPVNGFGTNGIPSKEFRISAAGSNFGLKGGEIQQPGHGCEVDRGLISSPTQKDNIDGDTGENAVLGQPAVTPAGTRQLFPARSLKDADITSFERTDGERGSFGSSAMTRQTSSSKDAVTSMGQNQDQDKGFTPKVYSWSSKPTDANLDTGSQEDQVLHVGNGGFEASAQGKDVQIVPNSSSRRKQRSSENKTRRWTQKIKERWRDRPGSFGKKGKEEGREDQKSEQGTESSPQKQLLTAETLINTSNKEEERTLPSLDSSDPSKTHTEDGTNEGHTRSSSDFEFGLGSFSLLEEIVSGQEWAKFLNPNQSAASANQRPSEEPPSPFKIPPNPHDSRQSSMILNQHGGVNTQWSFRGPEASPDSHFSMAQISPDAFLPVRMDITEGKQQQYVHREADQSEPMEHGHTRRPPSFVEPADTLINSALKSRVQLNRKRQHHSAERTEKISDGKEADRERFTSSPSRTSSHVMEEAGDNVMPLYTLNSPLSPSSFTSFAPAPKGVLKHSISQDSMESSMEIVTKRRRVEENRRVHFSEAVVTIAPPEPDLDATDSEEDSGAEEDSMTEQECEAEPAAVEEVAPARRPTLPAWILALKRRNTGRKHR